MSIADNAKSYTIFPVKLEFQGFKNIEESKICVIEFSEKGFEFQDDHFNSFSVSFQNKKNNFRFLDILLNKIDMKIFGEYLFDRKFCEFNVKYNINQIGNKNSNLIYDTFNCTFEVDEMNSDDLMLILTLEFNDFPKSFIKVYFNPLCFFVDFLEWFVNQRTNEMKNENQRLNDVKDELIKIDVKRHKISFKFEKDEKDKNEKDIEFYFSSANEMITWIKKWIEKQSKEVLEKYLFRILKDEINDNKKNNKNKLGKILTDAKKYDFEVLFDNKNKKKGYVVLNKFGKMLFMNEILKKAKDLYWYAVYEREKSNNINNYSLKHNG